MSVKLVSVTRPSIENVNMSIENINPPEKLSPEELIVYIARVSNPSNQSNMETAPKLINYLIKHKHWSPFEFVDLTVEIVTRRSIAAQILRHKSFSFQEFSQRYSTSTEIQPIQLRKQGKTNRQSSEDIIKNYTIERDIEQHFANSKLLYQKLIDKGVSRETARDVLPLSTETTMYMKGSIRSWIHYIELRCSIDTQLEHRQIAEGIKSIFVNEFPNITEAIGWKTN